MSPARDERAAPALSVVIGFRDWGLDRLAGNVRLHLRHAGPLPIEVVVSDYGSADPAAVGAAVAAAGGRVVRSEATGPWNRSAALNAGIAAARAPVIVTTDADILFAPGAYEAAARGVAAAPEALHLVQCRDLPPRHDAGYFADLIARDAPADFALLRRHATLRPRWGMGGFAAFSRRAFRIVNGYDERMQVWGKEDNDFAKRFRLLGMPLHWIADPEAAIFHMWHEPSRTKLDATEAGRRALAENQRILDQDDAPVRNLRRRFAGPPDGAEPLVSVVIPTRGRPAFLADALASCRGQSFDNFEVIVVENGDGENGDGGTGDGTGGAAALVAGLGDPRFRCLRSASPGAAAARNLGTRHARGRFIAIHDDDDLMVSTRLEDHLAALTGGAHGSYGGWLDIEAGSGRILGQHPGKAFGLASLLFSGKVLIHPCLMLDARLCRMFPYDERLSAGIDYGLILKLAHHGLRLNHTGRFGLLRRIHDGNMTRQAAAAQQAAARAGRAAVEAAYTPDDLAALKAAGRAALPLSCDNEVAAAAELGRYGFAPDPGHVPLPAAGPPAAAGPAPGPADADEEREILLGSGLFDAAWYAEAYPDVALTGLDPAAHFLAYGRLLRRRPGPDVDPAGYPDADGEGLAALLERLRRPAAASPG